MEDGVDGTGSWQRLWPQHYLFDNHKEDKYRESTAMLESEIVSVVNKKKIVVGTDTS